MRIARIWSVRGSHHRRGAAAIETIMILPVFMLIFMGCIDFGRFAYAFIAVTNAARAGAGVGIMSQYPDPDPTTGTGLANWQKSVCNAVANELGLENDFTPAGSSDPGGCTNSQGLYVNVSRYGEQGGLWRAQITARYPFTWWVIPSDALPQQTVVYRAIR
jgi:Flp pilus assembly protein TadG